MSISPLSISGFNPMQWPTVAPTSVPTTGSTGFQELLAQTWQDTQGIAAGAQARVEQNLISNDLSMVETFSAMREADVALRLMLQIRNKLVDAYQELQQIRF